MTRLAYYTKLNKYWLENSISHLSHSRILPEVGLEEASTFKSFIVLKRTHKYYVHYLGMKCLIKVLENFMLDLTLALNNTDHPGYVRRGHKIH